MATDIFYKMNGYLVKYNYYSSKNKIDIIDKCLREYLADKIKELKPNEPFIDRYNEFSVETLLKVYQDIDNSEKKDNQQSMADYVIHYLLTTIGSDQKHEILWFIDSDKNPPKLSVINGEIDSITTNYEDDSINVYRFVNNAIKKYYKK